MTPGVPGLGYATGNHGKCAACWKGQTVSIVGDDMNVTSAARLTPMSEFKLKTPRITQGP